MADYSNIANLGQSHFDTVTVAYPDTVTEVYSYRKGGLSGQVSLVVTVVYTTAAKELVQSVTRTPQRT